VDPLSLLWLAFCGAATWLAWKRRLRISALIGSPAALFFLFGSLPVAGHRLLTINSLNILK